MNNTVKTISFFLGVILLLSFLSSCTNEIKDNDTNVNLDIERSFGKLDIVPEDVSYSGETFNILCNTVDLSENYSYEVTSDGTTGDLVDMAVYKRNKDIEKRFDIKITTTEIPGNWDVKDSFIASYRDSVLSGAGSYDLLMGNESYMADCNLFGLYTNMYDVPYIKDDLEANYFYTNQVEQITYNGKLYFLTGDFCLSCLKNTYVMFFNKTLAGNDSTEKIYTLVNQGKWTVDNLIEMSAGFYRDLNGNQLQDTNDRFGYVTNILDTTDTFFSCFDCQATEKEDDNSIILNLDIGKMADIVYKMNSFFKISDVYTYYSSNELSGNSDAEKIFENNHALFYSTTLNHGIQYRTQEMNFGIVPLPKWNEKQINYQTQANNDYSVAVIPSDVKNIEKSGAILDVLMAESKKQVTPAYIHKLSSYKTTYDETTERMVKMIANGLQFNFGYFYYDNLRTGSILSYLFESDNDNFVSYYSANQRSYEKNLTRILNKYGE